MRAADLAGAELLAGLIETLHARPDLTTGVLLEHYRGHEWARWLDVLAHDEPVLSDPAGLREEFAACLQWMSHHAGRRRAQRRLDELKRRHPSALDADERRELAELAGGGSRTRQEPAGRDRGPTG